MAMSTWLQLVDDTELAQLEAAPASINQLDKPVCFRTHFFASLNYFLTGDAYPTDHPLAPALGGMRSIDTSTLECGNFTVLDSSAVPALLKELHAVKRLEIRAAVESADYGSLVDEQECYEFEVFAPDEIPDNLMNDLDSLIAFYDKVAAASGAVVGFTT